MSEVHPLPGRLAPWRRLFQWLSTLLLLAIPFVEVGGRSLVRLDAATRTLFFFGASLRIEEFYLLLLAALILVFGFLFLALVFGRVWCGWLCPQTTLGDLADWIDARFPAALRHFFYLGIAFLIGCNLVWYFIPPREFAARLFAGELGAVAGIALGATFLLVYLDLAFVRRRFCKTVCPYGRMQLMAMEHGTLTLGIDPGRSKACLNCRSCVRACPMGIDIRDGLQVECINCGRCLDACRDVMAARGGNGLIRYTFGRDGAGRPRILRTALVPAGAVLVLAALLAIGIGARKEATLKVQRAPGAQVKRMPDGSLINFYDAYIGNRATVSGTFSLEVAPLPGHTAELLGPVRDLELAPNDNRKVGLALKLTPAPGTERRMELKLIRKGKVVATALLPVAPE